MKRIVELQLLNSEPEPNSKKVIRAAIVTSTSYPEEGGHEWMKQRKNYAWLAPILNYQYFFASNPLVCRSPCFLLSDFRVSAHNKRSLIPQKRRDIGKITFNPFARTLPLKLEGYLDELIEEALEHKLDLKVVKPSMPSEELALAFDIDVEGDGMGHGTSTVNGGLDVVDINDTT